MKIKTSSNVEAEIVCVVNVERLYVCIYRKYDKINGKQLSDYVHAHGNVIFVVK